MFAADLSAVDSLQSSAWDYACVRQLHYCMLIIASYLRQRNCGGSDVTGAPISNAVPYTPFNEDLGINTLQVQLHRFLPYIFRKQQQY